jgi:hypothetical protein
MAMASEPWQSGNSMCERIIELQSRKQVIDQWLATAGVSARFSSDLQEMLTAVEAELTVLRGQYFATKYPTKNKRLELDNSRS